MREPKGPKSAIEDDTRPSEQQGSKSGMEGLSRRTFLGVGSASLATAALASLAVAQDRAARRRQSMTTRQAIRGRRTVAFLL